MNELQNNKTRPVNPRRRKRSQFEIFKEAYLPAIIACAALLLVVIFAIGSISRAIQHRKIEEQDKEKTSLANQQELDRLSQEADELIKDAATLAKRYDYDGAIKILDSFSGDTSKFTDISKNREMYETAKSELVLWEDNSKVINLSFQLLIADPARAFKDDIYGTSYNQNFVTTTEFTKILQQLYENNYILVSLDDIVTVETDEAGNSRFADKPLYLPDGKKPLILTQTNVNYNTYMVDGDGDKLADKDGDGFASRLLVDENGNLSCEIVNSDGTTSTGPYDLVPILDAFIQTHPEFSYKGAKAILAVTGYDGLFGYRTTAAANEHFGAAYHEQQVSEASAVIKALRDTGYEIASYTYENIPYGNYDTAAISTDLSRWSSEALPILGNVDILVYAKNSDISNTGTQYSGEKFNTLSAAGFQYYLGFCTDGRPWSTVTDNYFRQGRILVTGSNMVNHANWFDSLFDSSTVLESSRGAVSS